MTSRVKLPIKHWMVCKNDSGLTLWGLAVFCFVIFINAYLFDENWWFCYIYCNCLMGSYSCHDLHVLFIFIWLSSCFGKLYCERDTSDILMHILWYLMLISNTLIWASFQLLNRAWFMNGYKVWFYANKKNYELVNLASVILNNLFFVIFSQALSVSWYHISHIVK